jgi:hypothetical protein
MPAMNPPKLGITLTCLKNRSLHGCNGLVSEFTGNTTSSRPAVTLSTAGSYRRRGLPLHKVHIRPGLSGIRWCVGRYSPGPETLWRNYQASHWFDSIPPHHGLPSGLSAVFPMGLDATHSLCGRGSEPTAFVRELHYPPVRFKTLAIVYIRVKRGR